MPQALLIMTGKLGTFLVLYIDEYGRFSRVVLCSHFLPPGPTHWLDSGIRMRYVQPAEVSPVHMRAQYPPNPSSSLKIRHVLYQAYCIARSMFHSPIYHLVAEMIKDGC